MKRNTFQQCVVFYQSLPGKTAYPQINDAQIYEKCALIKKDLA